MEFLLLGHDAEHLAAVADSALEEVARIEGRLSRFDATSELARIHREAARGPAKLDAELFAILVDCLRWRRLTAGWFDVAAGTSESGTAEPYALDAERRSVTLAEPTIRLDFGGYAKGHAFDVAARLLAEYGLADALLHGGTSSICTLGAGPEGEGTSEAGGPIALVDPASPEVAALPNVLRRPGGGRLPRRRKPPDAAPCAFSGTVPPLGSPSGATSSAGQSPSTGPRAALPPHPHACDVGMALSYHRIPTPPREVGMALGMAPGGFPAVRGGMYNPLPLPAVRPRGGLLLLRSFPPSG